LYSRFLFLSGSGAQGAIGKEESRGGIGEGELLLVVVVESCWVEVVVESCFGRCEVECVLKEDDIESMSKSISKEKNHPLLDLSLTLRHQGWVDPGGD